jgi:hypothetical protein
MSSANEIINNPKGETIGAIAEGKKKKAVKSLIITKAAPVVEAEAVVGDLFATLVALPVVEEEPFKVRCLEPSKLLVTNMTTDEEDEEIEKELARRTAEVKAMRAKKALTTQLPELVNAYVAERELELTAYVAERELEIKLKTDVINKKIANARAGSLNEELLAKAGIKLGKPPKTKTGKPLVAIKSGLPRAEGKIGKGSMRDGKLKTLTRLNGAGIRWVKKGDKEYGIFKGDVCSRFNGVYLMPVWADLKKEFGFEKTMSLVLFKQQLSTQ